MSDPNPPSTTGAAAPTTHTISLNDLGQKYLGALQRVFDTAAFIVEGSRQVSERTYDDFSASVYFLPSQQHHRGFDTAKAEADRWILKNLLADAFSIMVPFLEDVRSIAALARWKSEGQNDQAALQRILSEDRRSFLKLDFAEKFAHLQNNHGISSPLASQIQAFARLGGCLTSRNGVVSEKDLTEGGQLAFTLVSLQLVPTQKAPSDTLDQQGSGTGSGERGGGATIVPQFGELRRSFNVGETIKPDKADYLNFITTLSLFVSSTLKGLQEKVKGLQGTSVQA